MALRKFIVIVDEERGLDDVGIEAVLADGEPFGLNELISELTNVPDACALIDIALRMMHNTPVDEHVVRVVPDAPSSMFNLPGQPKPRIENDHILNSFRRVLAGKSLTEKELFDALCAAGGMNSKKLSHTSATNYMSQARTRGYVRIVEGVYTLKKEFI